MACEYIEIDEIGHIAKDPVNIYIYEEPAVVVKILEEEGFGKAFLEFPAVLRGDSPNVTIVKAILKIKLLESIAKEILRLHLRLWFIEVDGHVVGNAHVDFIGVAAGFPPIRHMPSHDIGRAMIVDVFLKRGYRVEYERCEGTFENFDGYVAKIFKRENKGSI